MEFIDWLFFNTLLPLAPVPLVYFGSWLIGAEKRLTTIVRDGQVCFYCTTLSAGCIHEIVGKYLNAQSNQHTSSPATVGIAIAGIIACMILSTFTYGVAITAPPPTEGEDIAVTDTKLAATSAATALTTTIIVASSHFGLN